MGGRILTCALLSVCVLFAQADGSSHRVQFVTVDQNVRLEVLDWGGTGRPLVLLAGLGSTAHVFDTLAPKLAVSFHVYGITWRGYGASDKPASGYSADRLGDDVVGVMDALRLSRPVLAGHSIAGEELSSIGSRHPERVAGLIYLDAGYGYAYYDSSVGDLGLDLVGLQQKLDLVRRGMDNDIAALIRQLLESDLPGFEKDLREELEFRESLPAAMFSSGSGGTKPFASQLILDGEQKYMKIPVPILAIFAVPHDMGISDPVMRAAFDAHDEATTGAQARAFEKGLPTARVVRLPHANHFVFRSNEAEVLREIGMFIAGLP